MTDLSRTDLSGTDLSAVRSSIPAFGADLIELRREIHADPELGLQLPRTQARVVDALAGLDLELTLGVETTSVVAVLRGGGDARTATARGTETSAGTGASAGRPSVLLRGDMDGLPIVEQGSLPFKSTNGAMHACGHDLHTAGLVGAARLLAAARDELAGDVIFMFQPGEEGFNGAGLMIREGVLDAAFTRPIGAYGVHMDSRSPAGFLTTRPGTYMSAASSLSVTVNGRGGHGSRPYQALDPIQVAAEIITALQVAVTRRFDIFDPVIITVGMFSGGTASNVIPDTATFKASVRSFSEATAARLEDELTQVVQSIAQAHRMTADVAYSLDLPVTVNDAEHAAFFADTATELFGPLGYGELRDPKSGSEDFSRVLLEVPGAFGHLGGGSPDVDPAEWAPMHSARAQFDDRVLPDQALFLATLAERRLALAS